MVDKPDFQKTQCAFAAHIRDPEHKSAPANVEDRRMAIYRELFFNNLFNLLSGTFPVLKRIYADDKWRRLVRQFMIHHRAETPFFMQIPREFLDFLQNGYCGSDDDYPFLLELAHYEWVEIELAVTMAENDWINIDVEGDLLTGIPVKSCLAYVLAYQFPVQKISVDYLPQEAPEQTTYLSVYRKQDDELGFMELNPVTARLLQLIDNNEQQRSGKELLLALAKETNYADPDSLVTHGHEAMQQMRQSEIILGTLKPATQ